MATILAVPALRTDLVAWTAAPGAVVALVTIVLDYVTDLPWQAVPVAAVLVRNARQRSTATLRS